MEPQKRKCVKANICYSIVQMYAYMAKVYHTFCKTSFSIILGQIENTIKRSNVGLFIKSMPSCSQKVEHSKQGLTYSRTVEARDFSSRNLQGSRLFGKFPNFENWIIYHCRYLFWDISHTVCDSKWYSIVSPIMQYTMQGAHLPTMRQ